MVSCHLVGGRVRARIRARFGVRIRVRLRARTRTGTHLLRDAFTSAPLAMVAYQARAKIYLLRLYLLWIYWLRLYLLWRTRRALRSGTRRAARAPG